MGRNLKCRAQGHATATSEARRLQKHHCTFEVSTFLNLKTFGGQLPRKCTLIIVCNIIVSQSLFTNYV